VLDSESVARHVGLLLAAEIRELGAGQGVKTVLSLVSELEAAWLEEVYPDRVTTRHETRWNEQARAVETAEQRAFDDLVFDETIRPPANADEAAAVLADQIVKRGFVGDLRPDHWDERVEQWIARTRCVGDWFPDRRLIRYDEDDLRVILQEICAGASRFSQVKDRPCLPAVRDALSWDDQQFVERMAPERIELTGGWKMKVEYAVSGGPPRGRAKIQDFYGMTRTPTVAGGRIRVLLEILGPNFRPVQVTDDLESFWETLYPTLKKELSRKYPRHEWR
jgi:ATP-dependent helicase HrpB